MACRMVPTLVATTAIAIHIAVDCKLRRKRRKATANTTAKITIPMAGDSASALSMLIPAINPTANGNNGAGWRAPPTSVKAQIEMPQ